MLFSALNRFPPENLSVYVVRVLVAFGLFTFVSAVVVMIWQFFGDPFKKNKISYEDDGLHVSSYERPNELE